MLGLKNFILSDTRSNKMIIKYSVVMDPVVDIIDYYTDQFLFKKFTKRGAISKKTYLMSSKKCFVGTQKK
jgi:hypothetical protein